MNCRPRATHIHPEELKSLLSQEDFLSGPGAGFISDPCSRWRNHSSAPTVYKLPTPWPYFENPVSHKNQRIQFLLKNQNSWPTWTISVHSSNLLDGSATRPQDTKAGRLWPRVTWLAVNSLIPGGVTHMTPAQPQEGCGLVTPVLPISQLTIDNEDTSHPSYTSK